MYKYFFLFVSAIFCCAQCVPLQASHSESTSTNELHLLVNNSAQTTSYSYHLTPLLEQLEDMDQQIENQLQAVLPYLNFFFDSLLGQPKAVDEEDDCINNMEIELVEIDETALPSSPQPNEKTDKPQSEDQSEQDPDKPNTKKKSEDKTTDKPNTEEKSEDKTTEKPNTEEKSEDKTTDKSIPEPAVDIPVDNVQKSP